MEENTPSAAPAGGPEKGPADPRTGVLASALTPVAPARPIATSATHHDGGDTPLATSRGTAGHGGQSVPKALLLALVERWRQGPTLAQKRLEVAKEKAKALQVKENRTTQATSQSISKNERRADGKTESRSLGENKNHRQSQSKSDGKNHRDNRSAATSSRQDRNDHKNERRHNGTDTRKNERRHDGKHDRKDHTGRDHKGSDTRTDARKDERRHDGKGDHKDHRTEDRKGPRSGDHGHGSGHGGSGHGSGHGSGGGSHEKERRGGLLGLFRKNHADATGKTGKGRGDGHDTTPNRAADWDKPPAPEQRTQAKDPGAAKDPGKETAKTPKNAAKETPKDAPKTPTRDLPTRPTREAGYRDGYRAGRLLEHVKAYRDGTRDGYIDATTQGAHEKQALDAARARRQQTRTQEKPVTTPTAPAAPAPADVTPIEVTGVDADGVTLGAGADKPYLTRGEVRTMKAFEQRLTARAKRLAQIADRTKGLAAHAEDQAKKATGLADAARQVKGGQSLLPHLDKLAETARTQAAKADDLHTLTLRAAEHARLVIANVRRRDGAIYQAVIDSPETQPADMHFYQGN